MYEVNYNDERFKNVENQKNTAINEVKNTYDTMIQQSDKFYQDRINAVKDYENTQTKLQQENTDFAIEKINQDKEQAKKDYTKEQAGAYTDWQKESNKYGANAEQMAASGLTNSGYAESSQVSMYNTYQNRVAIAREAFNKSVLNYNNSIKEAQLANNSKLAEIAYNALQTQLELSLEGFQYNNTLVQNKLQMINDTDDRYYGRWKDVLSQINNENSLAEQIRQYNEKMAYQKERDKVADAQWQKEYELSKKKISSSSSSKSASISPSKSSAKGLSSKSTKKSSTSGGKYTSYTTPLFKGKTDYKWYTSNFGTKSFTKSELDNLVATGLSKGKIDEKDVTKIYKAYGLNIK